MTVNVQLQVSGDNISTYDIYQNTDDFSVALATGVTVAELQNNYSITANNSASVIRFVPDAACGNYKDVFINFNDTTPSITLVVNHFPESNTNEIDAVSMATNNKGEIFAMFREDTYISINNGTSWQTNTSYNAGNNTPAKIVCVNDNEFRVMKQNGEYFRWLNAGGWYATNSGMSHNITGTILDFHIHNGIYYARTENSIYRSEDGSTFISVLDYFSLPTVDINNSIAGYGNTLYATTYEALFKSVDNGLNWVEIANHAQYDWFSSLYVESETSFLVSTTNIPTTQWLWSQDGGDTLNNSWVPDASGYESRSNSLIKIGDVYYFNNSSGLNKTATSPFSNTSGPYDSIPGTNIVLITGASQLNGLYNSNSLIASENRIAFFRPKIGSFPATEDYSIYVGTITNT